MRPYARRGYHTTDQAGEAGPYRGWMPTTAIMVGDSKNQPGR